MSESEPAAVGMPAPDFELADVHGHSVRLSQFRDQKHVVLVFTRGFM